jgi:hypothetical protein
MITDFILNPSIDGLRANNFRSEASALRVQKNSGSDPLSGFEIDEKSKNQSSIDQSAYKLSISEDAKKLLKDEEIKKPEEKELTKEEQDELKELKKRDSEVRTHEQAHVAAAGQYASGGINLEYETGPDGKQYAVAGSVSIDTSKIPDDPSATIEKARQVRQAALAPAEPSGKDRQVAQEASKMEMEARAELQSKEEGEEPGAGVNASIKTLEMKRIDSYLFSGRSIGASLNIVA